MDLAIITVRTRVEAVKNELLHRLVHMGAAIQANTRAQESTGNRLTLLVNSLGGVKETLATVQGDVETIFIQNA